MYYKTLSYFPIILIVTFSGCSTIQPKSQNHTRNEPILNDNINVWNHWENHQRSKRNRK